MVNTYLVLELDVLLKWHQVPMKDVTTIVKKVEKWKQIQAGMMPPPFLIEVDSRGQLRHRRCADTAFGRHQETCWRQLIASIGMMTEEVERVETQLRAKRRQKWHPWLRCNGRLEGHI